MELSTRKVEIAGIALAASGLWMSQTGRSLTDAHGGILNGKRYLIHDRDPLFTAEFLETIGRGGVRSVKVPPRLPNWNAHAERFVRTNSGILSGPPDPVWVGGAADCHFPVHKSLPQRTEPPRSGEPNHQSGGELQWDCGRSRAATAPGRDAQLLLPRRGLN